MITNEVIFQQYTVLGNVEEVGTQEPGFLNSTL